MASELSGPNLAKECIGETSVAGLREALKKAQ